MNKLENDILTTRLNQVKNEINKKGIYYTRGIHDDNKKLTFAFVVYTLQRFTENYNIDEIINDVTEGGNDNSIDIFNIQEQDDEININIFQAKYKTENKLSATIGENEIDIFLNKIETIIINRNLDNLTINSYLKNKLDYYEDVIKSTNVSNIHLNLYLATNAEDINIQERNKLQAFKKKHPIINEIKVLNNYDFFINENTEEDKEIELFISDDNIKMNSIITACIVNFKVFELIKLYEQFQERILEKNVRKLIKSKINKSIQNSIQSDPKMFWYKNNGLSIVCKRFEVKSIAGQRKILLENPYIVNGGQTTKTIFNLRQKYKNDEDLEFLSDAYIMARIYQTTDEDQIAAIVQGTNTQNKITLYDLKSANANLRKLKDYFLTKNISLLIQRNCEEERLSQAITSELLLQIYCATVLKIPHSAKNNKNRIIELYYDDVYSDIEIHNKLYNCYLLYKLAEEKNKENTQLHLNNSLHTLLFVIYKLKPSIIDDEFKIEIANKFYYKALNIIDNIVEKEMATNQAYTHYNFFRSEYSTKQVLKYFEENLIQDDCLCNAN